MRCHSGVIGISDIAYDEFCVTQVCAKERKSDIRGIRIRR